MNLHVEWAPAIALRRVRGDIELDDADLKRVPAVPGVYVFGRCWGDNFEALYVGQAKNVRGRIKGQMNNHRLMKHVRDAKTGSRVVMVGSVIPKPGLQIENCLTLVERTLIRYFLAKGDDLVNISGTRLRSHEVVSTHRPKRFVPGTMYLDKSH